MPLIDPPTSLWYLNERCYIVSITSFLYVISTWQGGNNAGHTVKVGSQAYDFHLLPRYAVCLLNIHMYKTTVQYVLATK